MTGVTMLDNTEEATSKHVLIWAHRGGHKGHKETCKTTSRRAWALMQSGRIPRSRHVGLHTVRIANIRGEGTHPGSALCMESNVMNVTKTITSRQYAAPLGGNTQNGSSRC